MEYPHGHRHRNKRHSDSDDSDDDDREHYPPPRSAFNHPPPDSPPPRRPGFDDHPPPYRPDFDNYPPPPRPGFDEYPPRRPAYDQPPPPYRGEEDRYGSPPPSRPTTQVYHSSHAPPPHGQGDYGFSSAESDYPPPPRQYQDPPPPAYSGASVQHVSHDPDPDRSSESETHGHRPHLPAFMHRHTQESSVPDLSGKPNYKVYCKADPSLHLTVKDDKVVLAPSDPNNEYQNWYKDEKFSTRVKDKDGFPCFAIVNKATGQAVKHSVAASHPVQLVPYNADVLDQSVLWTESKDLGDGYRTVRMVNNIKLNIDAFQGNDGVADGSTVGVWEWNKGNNQRWRITLHCKFLNITQSKKLTLPVLQLVFFMPDLFVPLMLKYRMRI